MLSLNYENINYGVTQILKLSCVSFSYVNIRYVIAIIKVPLRKFYFSTHSNLSNVSSVKRCFNLKISFCIRLWISFPWIFPSTPIFISFKFLIHDSIKIISYYVFKLKSYKTIDDCSKFLESLYFRSIFNFLLIIHKFQSVAYVSNFMVKFSVFGVPVNILHTLINILWTIPNS